MSERILRALALPCLFAILVSGSSRIYQEDQEVRSLRHASCPSCRRERPDALVSWYSEPVRRDFRAPEPEIPWDRFQLDPYDRALGSRGGPPFGRFGGPGKREDAFALEGDVNFDLAPAPTSAVRSLEGAHEYQPRFQFPRSMARPSYLQPSFYNQISRQTDLGPSRYEPYGFGSAYEPYQVQRAQNYRSFERPLVRPQPYPGTIAGAPEQFFLPGEQFSPQAKHTYSLTPESSAYKSMQRGREGGWMEQLRREAERVGEYEGQGAKMAQRQGNGGRQSNGQFDSDEQEDMKEKRGAVNGNSNVEVLGRSKVSWNRLTKSSTDVSLPEIAGPVTEREPEEVTAKPVIAP